MKQTAAHHRRQAERVAVAGPGIVLCGKQIIACEVRDFSDKGARVECHRADDLPVQFILEFDGRSRTCQRMWRLGYDIGVEFREFARLDGWTGKPVSVQALRQQMFGRK